MSDIRALEVLGHQVKGWIVKAPGDIPVVTRGGRFQIAAEHSGYDVWDVGDETHVEVRLAATNVSAEVAAAYLLSDGAST